MHSLQVKARMLCLSVVSAPLDGRTYPHSGEAADNVSMIAGQAIGQTSVSKVWYAKGFQGAHGTKDTTKNVSLVGVKQGN
jgi:hypothetical protein